MFDFLKRVISSHSDGELARGTRSPGLDPGGKEGFSKVYAATNYRSAYGQSAGLERSRNEDCLFTLDVHLSGLEPDTTFGMFMIADGMGGHQHGEIASHLAVETATQIIIQKVMTSLFDQQEKLSDQAVLDLLGEAFARAQSSILSQVVGGGTTLTIVVILDDRIFTAHVGDCRIYRVSRENDLQQLSRDHSLVRRLVDLGEISEADAFSHPQRNVLYRALGQLDDLEVDLSRFSLAGGERLLLCSDGLWGVVSSEAMIRILQTGASLDTQARQLVQAAIQAGGPDNISVILVEKIAKST